jgi:hypothetical protein
MLRHRAGSAAATLVALAAGVVILMSMGTLTESGLRFRPEPQRYAAADLVVAHRDITFTGKSFDGETTRTTVTLPEGGTVPAALADQIRQLPGVTAAVADSPVAVVPLAAASVPATGHGWSSAVLTPYRLLAGAAPRTDGEVVLDARLAATAGLRSGQETELLVGGTARRYRISGIADGTAAGQPAAVFFTDGHAMAVSPHPGRVQAVGVIAVDRAALAPAVERLARDAGAKVYAGADRGLAERSDRADARELLATVGAVFGGYVAMLILFVVAGTIGLSVRHRRRDLALLRAIAATPGQVRRMIMAEAALVSGAAAVLGVPAGAVASRWVHGELVDRVHRRRGRAGGSGRRDRHALPVRPGRRAARAVDQPRRGPAARAGPAPGLGRQRLPRLRQPAGQRAGHGHRPDRAGARRRLRRLGVVSAGQPGTADGRAEPRRHARPARGDLGGRTAGHRGRAGTARPGCAGRDRRTPHLRDREGLRRGGVGRLAAVVNAVTGSPIPYVPPLGWVAVLGGASVLALTTTVLPVGRLLRASPIENIGLRE